MSWEEVLGPEACKGFVDVAWHGDSDGIRGDRDVHSQVSIAVWLDRQVVLVGAESGNEMICVRLRAISHTKIVHDETKDDVASFVLEETWCIGALVVAVFGEMRDEAKLTEAASLGKSIHTFSYLKIDGVVVKERFQVVGSNRCKR